MKPADVSSLRMLRRARDRIDRDYADPIDIPALAAGAEVTPVGEHPAAQADGASDVQDTTRLVAEAVDARSQRQAGARDRRDGGVHHPSPLHRGGRRQGLEAAAGRVPGPFGIKDLRRNQLRRSAAPMCVVPEKSLL